jgi:GntR family carbon starvation induced transcriptional regulator
MTVDTRTYAQAVQHRLAADILAGDLEPGRKLRLHALCESYGVGMSPLREALAGLAGQGLVFQDGQRGFRVAAASLEDLADVTFNRLAMETMALRLAMSRGGAEWEAQILASQHRLSRHPRTSDKLIDETWEDLHRAFHLSLIAACGSPRLIGFCRTLHDLFDRYRRLGVQSAGRHPKVSASHADLVAAVINRETDSALDLLDRHVAESAREISAMLSPSLGTAVADPAPGRSPRSSAGRRA